MEILNSFVRDSGRKRDPVRFARCCAVSWSGLILDEVEGAAYRLIGECYVHGLMRGQGVPEASADRDNSWIELV